MYQYRALSPNVNRISTNIRSYRFKFLSQTVFYGILFNNELPHMLQEQGQRNEFLEK